MQYGLMTVFGGKNGGQLTADMATSLHSLQMDGPRCDMMGATAEQTSDVCWQAINRGLLPLLVIDSLDQLRLLPVGTHVEWRNEPDLNGPDPATYLVELLAAAKWCLDHGLHLWGGSISNFNDRGFTFLDAIRPKTWPAGVHVSAHWYPHGSNPWVPHPGFSNRDAEVNRFLDTIGTRYWGISEFGYHTGTRLLYGFLPTWWSDEEVKVYTAWEWAFWKRMGARFAVAYQVNDGPASKTRKPALTKAARDAQTGASFGWRKVEWDQATGLWLPGDWKPVSTTVIQAKLAA